MRIILQYLAWLKKKYLKEKHILKGEGSASDMFANYRLISSRGSLHAKYFSLPIFIGLLSVSIIKASMTEISTRRMETRNVLAYLVENNPIMLLIFFVGFLIILYRIVYKYLKINIIYMGKDNFLAIDVQKDKIYSYKYSDIYLVYGPTYFKDDLIKIKMKDNCEIRGIYFFPHSRRFQFWEDHPIVLELNTLRNKK